MGITKMLMNHQVHLNLKILCSVEASKTATARPKRRILRQYQPTNKPTKISGNIIRLSFYEIVKPDLSKNLTKFCGKTKVLKFLGNSIIQN